MTVLYLLPTHLGMKDAEMCNYRGQERGFDNRMERPQDPPQTVSRGATAGM